VNLEEKNKISKFRFFKTKLKKTIRNFSLTEKTLFVFFLFIFLGSLLSLTIKINNNFLVKVPQKGGEIKEGLIGVPRFINPVIAISETDRDLSTLIYSGLLKINSKGEAVNDLAESITISEDGLNYDIKIKDNAYFHDGKPVTVDDLLFTIGKTQDPAIKSPKRPNWDGIVVEKINDKEVSFTLKQAYSPFIYNLTLGILPKHIWNEISSDEFAFSKYNLEPIGSGPFEVSSVKKDSDGIIKKFSLRSFNKYTLSEPFLNKLSFTFYKNEDDLIESLNKGNIDSAHSISPLKIKEVSNGDLKIHTSSFSRTFALYLNKSSSEILSDINVRKVLNLISPQEEIIQTILMGYAKPTNSPVPKTDFITSAPDLDTAKNIIEDEGWSKNDKGIYEKDGKSLKFSISTANVDELINVTELLAKKYREFGFEIDVKIFEPNDLTLNVIRPRNFESIFFGQVINKDLDLYGFWHSSQRNDPGLNISGFTNIEADKELEKIRGVLDQEERNKSLQIFEKEVINEIPAIFLYSPDFLYITSSKLQSEIPQSIVTSSDRFTDIEKWYIETDFVWKIFAK
jgi:peptide/nickel transport system substrate-binding protein